MKLNREETMNKSNHDELISGLLDGELSDAQLDALLDGLKGPDGQRIMQTWNDYHSLGDILRSDDLAISLSPNFSATMAAKLAAEPVILSPQRPSNLASNKTAANKSAYWAMTSVAATVMLALLMAPQIIPLLKSSGDVDSNVAKVEATDAFTGPGVKLASNSAASSNASSANMNSHSTKDTEFAPKLENQVEMLRDPRLDSYLLAHQKVSPSLDNSARYVQRANVVSPTESKK